MPETRVILFRDADGSAPVLEWLDRLPSRVQIKCQVKIQWLIEKGFELRRPDADYLRDGIYELRIRRGNVHYRILYFFHGRKTAVLARGLIKERRVPSKEIETAIRRMNEFKADPAAHTFEEGK